MLPRVVGMVPDRALLLMANNLRWNHTRPTRTPYATRQNVNNTDIGDVHDGTGSTHTSELRMPIVDGMLPVSWFSDKSKALQQQACTSHR
jgi:hypothetical protein